MWWLLSSTGCFYRAGRACFLAVELPQQPTRGLALWVGLFCFLSFLSSYHVQHDSELALVRYLLRHGPLPPVAVAPRLLLLLVQQGCIQGRILAAEAREGVVLVLLLLAVDEVVKAAAAHELDHDKQPVGVGGRPEELAYARVPQRDQDPQLLDEVGALCVRALASHVGLQTLHYYRLHTPF